MVKRRYQRKYVTESSDESDSDDFYEEESRSPGDAKKYSLRQRRGANLAEDFDYDVGDGKDNNVFAGTEVLRSDDEDFELSDALKHESSIVEPQTSVQNTAISENKLLAANCTITKFKEREVVPEIPKNNQSSADMIDFEDVIRADILVNQNKIDYDCIIEKSEIKVMKQETDQNKKKVSDKKFEKKMKNKEPPKKRGRKPKQFSCEDDDSYENGYKSNDCSTGLPINTVLGVTESLYELAERYHLQEGIMAGEMVQLPLEPILTESISPIQPKTAIIEGNNEVTLNPSDSSTGAIQIC